MPIPRIGNCSGLVARSCLPQETRPGCARLGFRCALMCLAIANLLPREQVWTTREAELALKLDQSHAAGSGILLNFPKHSGMPSATTQHAISTANCNRYWHLSWGEGLRSRACHWIQILEPAQSRAWLASTEARDLSLHEDRFV
jgi:hypothetical protein